jgi:hypothetical protein
MAQFVSRCPLTAEAQVRVRVNPCGICGGQSGTGTGFPSSSSVFPCQYIILLSLSLLVITYTSHISKAARVYSAIMSAVFLKNGI